jgi:hypothetical protein
MRSRFAGGCCWRSRRPNVRAIPRSSSDCSPSSSSGVVQPVSNWPVPWPRLPATRCAPSSIISIRAAARIVLVEAGPSILSTFPESLRDAGRRSLRRLGVDVHEGTPVTALDEDGVAMGDTRISSATVLWAAGVQASPIGACFASERERDGRVRVEPDLSVRGYPTVSSLEIWRCSPTRPASRCPAWRKRQATGYARGAQRAAAPGGGADPPFRYRDPGNLATIAATRRLPTSGSFACQATWAGCSGSSCTSPS